MAKGRISHVVTYMERDITKIYRREKRKTKDRNIKQGPHMEEKQTDRQTYRKLNWVLKGWNGTPASTKDQTPHTRCFITSEFSAGRLLDSWITAFKVQHTIAREEVMYAKPALTPCSHHHLPPITTKISNVLWGQWPLLFIKWFTKA